MGNIYTRNRDIGMPASIKKDPRRRVIRSSKNANASLVLSDNSAKLVGDSRHFIAVDERGVTIKGPISLVTDGTGIRRGALFVQMPDMIRMIPSTIVTPLPSQIPIPPIHGLINLKMDTALFLSLLV
jgi:hypothetical protein